MKLSEKLNQIESQIEKLNKEAQAIKKEMVSFVQNQYEQGNVTMSKIKIHPKSRGKAVNRVLSGKCSDYEAESVYKSVCDHVGQEMEFTGQEIVVDHKRPLPSTAAKDERGEQLKIMGFFIRIQARYVKKSNGKIATYHRWIASKSFRTEDGKKKQVTVALGKELPRKELIEFRIEQYLKKRPELNVRIQKKLNPPKEVIATVSAGQLLFF